jgi:riboflavin kinase/FMN adenylyltransferase
LQVFSGIEEFNAHAGDDVRTAIAIGKFDGIHLGHEKLLREIMAHKDMGLRSLVFTFERPVSEYFTGKKTGVLATEDEKRDYLESLGIDYLYLLPVNRETMSYDPRLFVSRMLSEGLHASLIAAGSDLSFGDRGAGDMALLKEMSRELGYETVEIEKVRYRDRDISSTLIRQALAEGDMESVTGMLGRPYSLEGTVVTGAGLGHTIDMPTANIMPDTEKLLPPYGVYLAEVYTDDGRKLHGITNIGVKPTVSDEDSVSVETYIHEFTDDIYGAHIRLGLTHFMRPEKKFANLGELKKQLRLDKMNLIVSLDKTEQI